MRKTIKLPSEFDPTPEIDEQIPIMLAILDALQGKAVPLADAEEVITSGGLVLMVRESEEDE